MNLGCVIQVFCLYFILSYEVLMINEMRFELVAEKFNLKYISYNYESCMFMPHSTWYTVQYYKDKQKISNAVSFKYDERAKRIIPDKWETAYPNTISIEEFEQKIQNMLIALKEAENQYELDKIKADFE